MLGTMLSTYLFFVLLTRDGRLQINDQIIRINGRSLEGFHHNDAIKLLQAEQGVVKLVITRENHAPNLHSPQSSQAAAVSHGTEHAPTTTATSSSSSASSALTTPLTGASTSSESSQKNFALPQVKYPATGSMMKPHPSRMSQYLEEELGEQPSVST